MKILNIDMVAKANYWVRLSWVQGHQNKNTVKLDCVFIL